MSLFQSNREFRFQVEFSTDEQFAKAREQFSLKAASSILTDAAFRWRTEAASMLRAALFRADLRAVNRCIGLLAEIYPGEVKGALRTALLEDLGFGAILPDLIPQFDAMPELRLSVLTRLNCTEAIETYARESLPPIGDDCRWIAIHSAMNLAIQFRCDAALVALARIEVPAAAHEHRCFVLNVRSIGILSKAGCLKIPAKLIDIDATRFAENFFCQGRSLRTPSADLPVLLGLGLLREDPDALFALADGALSHIYDSDHVYLALRTLFAHGLDPRRIGPGGNLRTCAWRERRRQSFRMLDKLLADFGCPEPDSAAKLAA